MFGATFCSLAVLLCSLQLAATNARGELPQQLATPLPLLVVVAVLAAAAAVGMDRRVVRVGRPEAVRT